MRQIRLLRLKVVFCFVCFTANICAQKTPYLERLVTVKAYNQTLAEVFKSISSQADVVFSYTNFNDQQKVTANHYRKPLRAVLNDLLKETNCTYKMKDKYVILSCSDKVKTVPESIIHLTGYIYNAKDSSRVENASIYVRENRHSATSSKYGYFSMSYPKAGNRNAVSVARENFRDTTLTLAAKSKQEIHVYLQPSPSSGEIFASIKPVEPAVIPVDIPEIAAPTDTIQEAPSAVSSWRAKTDSTFQSMLLSGFNFWNKLKSRNTSLRNISDTLFTTVSFSLIPSVSTNRLLSINTVNKLSFNLLAGQSKGVDIFELGVLLNIDNGDVRYGQIAGLSNVVSGNVLGGQVAGLVNYNSQDMTGGQVAGLTNIVKGNVKYGQVAGISNIVKGDVTGMQVGGLVNVNNGNTLGLQAAGIVNIDRGDARYLQIGGIGNIVNGKFTGLQAAGLFNSASYRADGLQVTGISNNAGYFNGLQVAGISNHVKYKLNGMQIAGISNYADTVNGIQLSGFFNNSGTTRGMQIAGFMNRTRELKGVQLSFLNFSNTASGVPIGFFSYVHKGYHKIELGADELMFGTIAFRSGVNAFHNIFLAGISLEKPNNLWTYGYGLGSAFRMSEKWYLNLDVTAQQFMPVKGSSLDAHCLGKGFFGVEFSPFRKFSLAMGPTYNVFVSDTGSPDYTSMQDNIVPAYHFLDETYGNINVKMWVGGKICLRFL